MFNFPINGVKNVETNTPAWEEKLFTLRIYCLLLEDFVRLESQLPCLQSVLQWNIIRFHNSGVLLDTDTAADWCMRKVPPTDSLYNNHRPVTVRQSIHPAHDPFKGID